MPPVATVEDLLKSFKYGEKDEEEDLVAALREVFAVPAQGGPQPPLFTCEPP